MLKKVAIAQRVEKYGKYGLYDNNRRLYCKPCGKKTDDTWEDSLTKHGTSGIHDVVCAKHIRSLFFVLALIVLRGTRLAYCWCCAGRGANRPACIRQRDKCCMFPAARWCIICMEKQVPHQIDYCRTGDKNFLGGI